MEKEKVVRRLMLHYGNYDKEKIEHIYDVLKEYFPSVLRGVEEGITMEDKIPSIRL